MLVIPTINCENFECVKSKIRTCAGFLPKGGFAQIDIGDGEIGSIKTWNDPKELKSFLEENPIDFNFEIHLMTKNPVEIISDWQNVNIKNVKRFIIQYEAILDNGFDFLKTKNNFEVEYGISFGPQTLEENLLKAVRQFKNDYDISFFQILSVNPGASGQEFQENSLNKIKLINAEFSEAIIEVDGGVNLEIAKQCKENGASVVCSGNYLLNSENPNLIYKEFSSI